MVNFTKSATSSALRPTRFAVEPPPPSNTTPAKKIEVARALSQVERHGSKRSISVAIASAIDAPASAIAHAKASAGKNAISPDGSTKLTGSPKA